MCEISEEYNAKRGSEPSKTIDFCIDLSWIFHVFFQTTLQRPSLEVQAPVYTQKCDFGTIYDFLGVQQSTLGTTFPSPKSPFELPGESRGTLLEPTRARFGVENAPRTHFHRFVILERFWTNVGWIFDYLSFILDVIFV